MQSRVPLSEVITIQDFSVTLLRRPVGVGHFAEPTLLFLHGRCGLSAAWQPLIDALGDRFGYALFDFPGFGHSAAWGGRKIPFPEMIALTIQILDHQAPGKVILIGHDTGGAIAQACAVERPDRVAALVLINAACVTQALSPLIWRFLPLRIRRRYEALLRPSQALAPHHRDLLGQCIRDRHARRSWMQALRRIQRSWPEAEARLKWQQSVARIARPVLMLWGGRDWLCPPESAHHMLRHLPDAHYFQNDDCGHWPFLEATAWTASKIREFLFHIETPADSIVMRSTRG